MVRNRQNENKTGIKGEANTMGMIDKKIYRMGGKIIGGVAEVTVIFTDGSVYYFKGNIRNGSGSHSIMPKPAFLNTPEQEGRRIAS